MSLIIRDLSKFQGVIPATAWATIQAESTGVVILRAHNGYSVDPCFAYNRAAARQRGMTVVDYQYLLGASDAAGQARGLLAAVGTLGPDETLCLDLEEGSGDQSGRARAWLATVAPTLAGRRALLYSGDAFYRGHGLAATATSFVEWIARYSTSRPVAQADVWQNTDHRALPGVGYTDASTYAGTRAQLRGLLNLPSAPTSTGDISMADAASLAAQNDRNYSFAWDSHIALFDGILRRDGALGTAGKQGDPYGGFGGLAGLAARVSAVEAAVTADGPVTQQMLDDAVAKGLAGIHLAISSTPAV